MAVLKNKDIKKMNAEERKKKLEELRMELIKKNVQANKSGKIKAKEIKKAIARILTNEKSSKLREADKNKDLKNEKKNTLNTMEKKQIKLRPLEQTQQK